MSHYTDPAEGGHEPTAADQGIGVTDGEEFQVTIRGMREPRARGRRLAQARARQAFLQALEVQEYPALEPVIEWTGTTELAAVDLDYHDVALAARPSDSRLTAIASQVLPRPSWWWRTHGHGLRLIYLRDGAFAADELAAVASLYVRGVDPRATLEIKAETRHPRYLRPNHPPAGEIHAEETPLDLGPLQRLLGREIDDQAIADWLSERGLSRGQNYAHEHCPCDPGTESHGNPVFVGEDGIFCHRCQAGSLSLGGHRPGFFSFAALVSGGISRAISKAIRGLCHWGHAHQIVLHDTGLEGRQAEMVYRALLRMVHGPDDPRIDLVFHRGFGLVRMRGYWATADLSRAHSESGLAARLAALPAVQYLEDDKDGERPVKVNQERLGIFRGIDDLSPFGYPALKVVRGMPIWAQWLTRQDDSSVPTTVVPDVLRPDAMRRYRPVYLPASRRMPLADAEQILERSFPGINLAYLRLLIAARGCAEGGSGQPPMIAVSGPSGAGKSLTPAIAAAIIGDRSQTVPFARDVSRLHLAIYDASQRASFVLVDELVKQARDQRTGSLVGHLTALLTYVRGTMVRQLYLGNLSVTELPIIIVSDVDFPHELRRDHQLGRRFALVRLDRSVNWQQTARTGVENWRIQLPEHADAGNAIVSELIDRFFTGPEPPVFQDIARALGFGLLDENEDPDLDPQVDLLRMFAACRDLAVGDVRDGTWTGRGWKVARPDGVDPVSAAWRAVCDDQHVGFSSSRRLKEADFAAILGAHAPIDVDIRVHGRSVGIRFRQGPARSPDVHFNGEIVVDSARPIQVTHAAAASAQYTQPPLERDLPDVSGEEMIEELV